MRFWAEPQLKKNQTIFIWLHFFNQLFMALTDISRCCFDFHSGSIEWINVPNPDAEPLWSSEIRRTLQCWRRPSQRNQTSMFLGCAYVSWLQLFSFVIWRILQLSSLLSALEAAAGRYKSFDQRHQRRLGRHQAHRARTQRRWPHEGRDSKLSTRHYQNSHCQRSKIPLCCSNNHQPIWLIISQQSRTSWSLVSEVDECVRWSNRL